jgi:Ca2+-binding RTX toxin-like protein
MGPETLEIRQTPATFVVTNVNDGGANSLRVAIDQANATPGADVIDFLIPGGGVQTINLLSPLSPITESVLIDGTTEPGYAPSFPQIEISGAAAGASADGFIVNASNTTIQGLAINQFSRNGIFVLGTGVAGNVIRADMIGTDPTGSLPRGNTDAGIKFAGGASNNTVGGTSANDRNVISGNAEGVVIDGSAGAVSGNLVEGNSIGTDYLGSAAVPNADMGVSLAQASNNAVGGTAIGAGNIISGNGANGVNLQGNSILSGGVGWWTADALDASDSVGGDNGTLVGGVTFASGQVNAAFQLDGSSQYVSIPDTVALRPAQVTLDAWVNPGRTGQASVIISKEGDLGSGQVGYALRQTVGDRFQFALGAIGADVAATSTTPVTAGVWTHLLGTYDGSQMTLYVNGVQEGVATTSGAITSTQPMLFGGQTGATPSQFYEGLIDEVAVFDRPLTATEAQLIAHSGNAPGNVIEGNLIGLKADGTALGNTGFGIATDFSSWNSLGGTTAGAGNVVSGNLGLWGINISGGGTGDFNLIAGNIVGADPTGLLPRGNTFGGIQVGSSHNTVGGTAAAASNVVGGNQGDGIRIVAFANTTLGNLIGLASDGVTPLGNGGRGIDLISSNGFELIGGLSPGAGNRIANNADDGIFVFGSGDNTIAGNVIGLDSNDAAAGNNNGISVLDSNNVITANIVSANHHDGIALGSSVTGNLLTLNKVGTDSGGANARGNAGFGVVVFGGSTSNTIGGASIQGNVLSGNLGAGLALLDATTQFNVVRGNLIGTDLGGGVALPNTEGILIQGAQNNVVDLILGAPPNVISGNIGSGIHLTGGATGNQIFGNYVGTDASGAGPLGNSIGINIEDSPDNTIGGTVPGQTNLISGNLVAGITINSAGQSASGNVIVANLIGTDIGGAYSIANGDGINVSNADTQIGGTSGTEGNLISGNADDGIVITGNDPFTAPGTGSLIAGNRIGTNAAGLLPLPNDLDGVALTDTSFATVGGTTSAASNLIAANLSAGIAVNGNSADADSDVIQGNLIGSDRSGLNPLGNQSGIVVSGTVTNLTIGGAGPGEGNLISGSSVDNVAFFGVGGPDAVIGNLIGTDITAAAALSVNPLAVGVHLEGSSGVTLGGMSASAANVISGNTTGVLIDSFSSNNIVEGNKIGTDLAGAFSVPNAQDGVLIEESSNNTIGAVGAGNLISGNGIAGLELTNNFDGSSGGPATQTTVVANLIGVNAAGTGAIPNGTWGMLVSGGSFNTVGGTVAGSANVVSGNSQGGIAIYGGSATNNLLEGDVIGTDATGRAPLGNAFSGVFIGDGTLFHPPQPGVAHDNTVGGIALGMSVNLAANVISANQERGILIEGAGATANLIQGNFIGTDRFGDAGLGNGLDGLQIIAGDHNTLGGTGTLAGNIISGNALSAIHLSSAAANNLLEGNLIGLAPDGATALANFNHGVLIDTSASANTIGAGNVISGNVQDGVHIQDSQTLNNVVEGNEIGTDSTGTIAVPNGQNGVGIWDGPDQNTIGGSAAGAGNQVSGNGGNGIFIFDTYGIGNVVLGNLVGTDPNGTSALPNQGAGIEVQLSNDQVVGAPGGAPAQRLVTGWSGNLFSGNHLEGVRITVNSSATVVSANLIGTDISGMAAVPNRGGILIGGSLTPTDNTIGGITSVPGTGPGNVISGNLTTGVTISNNGTADNDLWGNLIGTTADGLSALPNANEGVVITSQAGGNQIGGPARNIISGNGLDGVVISSGAFNNTVARNFIGTDITGAAPLPNVGSGIVIDSTDGNVIGADPSHPVAFDPANVISGNMGSGVVLQNAAVLSRVSGNLIGVDVTGEIALGNGGDGVSIVGGSFSNSIGGGTPALGNVISANLQNGISLADTGTTSNQIQSNEIGTDKSGELALGNQVRGIEIVGADHTQIGGVGAGNLVSGNSFEGIALDTGSSASVVEGNSVGTDISGRIALGNGGDGILVTNQNQQIGGTAVGAGNVISGNVADGIDVSGTTTTNTLIVDNFIGLNAAGNAALGNSSAGVEFRNGANGATVGGTASGTRNLIAANFEGVRVGVGSSNVTIEGNLIGTDGTGTLPVGNTFEGVGVFGTNVTVGGTTELARNIISGNNTTFGGLAGVYLLNADSVVVEGNYVGTDVTGNNALANSAGVRADSSTNTTIGGTTPGAGNLISGNMGDGIQIENNTSAANNLIQGNLIGTTFKGTVAVPNSGAGITLLSTQANMIGGTVAGARNVIAGSTGPGIAIQGFSGDDASANQIQGNYIGTDISGAAGLPNQGGGLTIDTANNNLVGGSAAHAGNVIAFNVGAGVTVFSGTGNTISDNATFANTALGIDLGGDGVTLNDSKGHSGPNVYQDFPVLATSVSTATQTTITGTVEGPPSSALRIEFFTMTAADPSGYGQGQTFFGAGTANTDGSGLASFTIVVNKPMPGHVLTATATDVQGNTSEFAQNLGGNSSPVAVIALPPTGNQGARLVFDGTHSFDPNGDPISYSWTFGDGASDTGPSPSHAYDQKGTYTVTLTVRDGFGGMNTASAQLIIQNIAPTFVPAAYGVPQVVQSPISSDGFGSQVVPVGSDFTASAPTTDGGAGQVYLYYIDPTPGPTHGLLISRALRVGGGPADAPGGQFGAAIAAVGANQLLVGAPGDHPSLGGGGAAFVFDIEPESPTFGQVLATLVGSTPTAGDGFGRALSVVGPDVVVGESGSNVIDNFKSLTIPIQGLHAQPIGPDQTYADPDQQPGDGFGTVVAALGTTIGAGAPGENGGDGVVYQLDLTGALLQTLSPVPGSAGNFGGAMTAVGDSILIGSPMELGGAARLYDAGGNLLHAFLPPVTGGGRFGAALGASGKQILIGAPRDSLGFFQSGSAYIFNADPASPDFGGLTSALQEPTPRTGDGFGGSVAFGAASNAIGLEVFVGAGSGAHTVSVFNPGSVLGLSASTVGDTPAGTATIVLHGQAFKPSRTDAIQVLIDWGDTSTSTLNLPPYLDAFAAPHVYALDRATPYPIVVTLTDALGGTATASTSVRVQNTAPILDTANLAFVLGGATVTDINEGDQPSLHVQFADHGAADAHTVQVNWGDGSLVETHNLPPGKFAIDLPHLFQDNPHNPTHMNKISVTVQDSRGGSSTDSILLAVENVVPTVDNSVWDSPSINEGDTATLTGHVTDPGGFDTESLVIDWGDPSADTSPTAVADVAATTHITLAAGLRTWSAVHRFRNNSPVGSATGVDHVSITSTDNDGAVSPTAVIDINVANVTPVAAIRAELAPGANTASQVALIAELTDPGALDTFSYSWTATNGGVSYSSSAPTFSISAPFDQPLLVRLTVNDDDGAAASDISQIFVIPQPFASVFFTPPGGVGTPSSMVDPSALRIIAFNYGGFDTLDASALSIPAELVGDTANSNVLVGGPKDDILAGGAAADSLVGNAGNDTLIGNHGDDTMDGGSGDNNFFVVPGSSPILRASGNGFNTIDFSGVTQGKGPASDQGVTVDLSKLGAPQPVDTAGNTITLIGQFRGVVGTKFSDCVTGGAGDDLIFGGTSGNDTFMGGSGNSKFVGGGGNDLIFGGTGDTTVTGGSGNTMYHGGKGNDVVFGGTGDTTVMGGSGNTVFHGGTGNDVIFGGPGNTTVVGGSGNTSVTGGKGNDIVFGGPGGLTAAGGSGNDIIYGGAGPTSVAGGSGNDIVYGGTGNTSVTGGTGNGSVIGGSGNNSITGGTGNDVIFGGAGDSTVAGGAGNSVVMGGTGNDVVFGGDGNVTISGSGDHPSLMAGKGNDLIFGGTGSASIVGGSGDSTLVGGTGGGNTIIAGTGNDVVFGGPAGGDSIVGGTGNVTIVAGDGGNNTITGAKGNDVIFGGAAGHDLITGGPGGSNMIVARGGDDVVFGGAAGNNSIASGGGNDIIFGGAGGHNSIASSGGNDIVYGGATGPGDSMGGGAGGGNTINAGGRNDVIFGGAQGGNSIQGNGGNDVIFGGAAGQNSIAAGGGNDIVFGGASSAGDSMGGGSGGQNVITGGGGNDLIYAGAGGGSTVSGGAGGGNTMLGGKANDVIFGGLRGHDSIIGSDGNGTIHGGRGGYSTVKGGDGDDLIVGGEAGHDVIDGNGGDDTVTGGAGGATTITAGSGNDQLTGGGQGSWLIASGDFDFTLTDTGLKEVDHGGATAAQDVLSGFDHARLAVINAQGTSFGHTLDATGFSGGAALVGGLGPDSITGGSGSDTFTAGQGNDTITGHSGNDTFTFPGNPTASMLLDDNPNGPGATLDFSSTDVPVYVDLEEPSGAILKGGLKLQAVQPLAFTNVIGSPYDDVILGGPRSGSLIGGGGRDLIVGRGKHDYLQGRQTQVVYLDFTSNDSVPGERTYSQADRDAVQARMTAAYSAYAYSITQEQPSQGPYTTMVFNDPRLDKGDGGIAGAVDWRNLNFNDGASINVNSLLDYLEQQGLPDGFTDETAFVAMTSDVVEHELGHLQGLRHGDAFGPIGAGIFSKVDPARFFPGYPGPAQADETAMHIMASPASVESSLTDALGPTFFGAREDIKLAQADHGEVLHGLPSAQHDSIASAQPIALAPLAVPNTILSGRDAGRDLDVHAIDVAGHLGDALGTDAMLHSLDDFYALTAHAGDLLTFELMSASLGRIGQPFDGILRLSDSAGTVLSYYRHDSSGNLVVDSSGHLIVGGQAQNDDSFQSTDPVIIDYVAPADMTIYVEVDNFDPVQTVPDTALPDYDQSDITGDYELFVYAYQTNSRAGGGSTILGGSGGDTIAGGAADDTIKFNPFGDTFIPGSGRVNYITSLPPQDLALAVDQDLTTPIPQGTPIHFTASWTDFDFGAAFHVNYQVLDGSSAVIASGTLTSFNHAPGSSTRFESTLTDTRVVPGDYSVLLTLVDDSGNQLGPVTASFTIANVPPTVTAPNDLGFAEGVAQLIDLGQFIDPGIQDAPWTVDVDWNDGSPHGTLTDATEGAVGSLFHRYGDEGDYKITVTVADKYNSASAPATFTAHVGDFTPVVAAGGDITLTQTNSFARSGSFSDPSDDTWTATVDYGDGAGTQSLALDAAKTFALDHAYTQNGTHNVTVTVLDDEGHPGSTTFQVNVAFGPNVTNVAIAGGAVRNTAVTTAQVTFDKPIDPATLNASAVILTRNNNKVSLSGSLGAALVSGTTSTYQITLPASASSPEGTYVLTVDGTKVKDPADKTSGSGTASAPWLMDTTLPSARVDALAPRQASLVFPITVTATDPAGSGGSPASGVAAVDIYAATDGKTFTFFSTLTTTGGQLVLSGGTYTGSVAFTGQSNTTYSFVARARDNAGNAQPVPNVLQASTFVPDLTPPATQVSTVDSSTPQFVVHYGGADIGGSGLASFTIYVSLDGAVPGAVATVPASSPGGISTGTLAYQALADSAPHTYRFFSIGTDFAGNVEPAPTGAGGTIVSQSFATPAALAATAFSVQHGSASRSYIRYLDLTFNETDAQAGGAISASITQPALQSGQIQLIQHRQVTVGGYTVPAISGEPAGADAPVDLTQAKLTVIDHLIEIDFGAGGLGGSPASIAADGYYELVWKTSSNQVLADDFFYRMLGDVNGDHSVDTTDISLITADLGKAAPNLATDVDGNGSVNATDRILATKAKGHKLVSGLHLDG